MGAAANPVAGISPGGGGPPLTADWSTAVPIATPKPVSRLTADWSTAVPIAPAAQPTQPAAQTQAAAPIRPVSPAQPVPGTVPTVAELSRGGGVDRTMLEAMPPSEQPPLKPLLPPLTTTQVTPKPLSEAERALNQNLQPETRFATPPRAPAPRNAAEELVQNTRAALGTPNGPQTGPRLVSAPPLRLAEPGPLKVTMKEEPLAEALVPTAPSLANAERRAYMAPESWEQLQARAAEQRAADTGEREKNWNQLMPRLIPTSEETAKTSALTDAERAQYEKDKADIAAGKKATPGKTPDPRGLPRVGEILWNRGQAEDARKNDPIAAKMTDAVQDFASGLSRADQVALIAMLGGKNVLSKLATVYFGYQAGKGAVHAGRETVADIEAGKKPQAAYDATTALLNTLMFAGMARHGAREAGETIRSGVPDIRQAAEGAHEALLKAGEPKNESPYTIVGHDAETGLPIMRRKAGPEATPLLNEAGGRGIEAEGGKPIVPRGTVLAARAGAAAPPIGATEPETGRPVLQEGRNPEGIQAVATAEHPEIRSALEGLMADVPGAKISGARPEKELERRDEKIEEEGQSPRTVRDYSGYRIAVDTPQAAQATLEALGQRFELLSQQDHFAGGDPEFGFHSLTVNVREPGSEVSHEVQILPREVAEHADSQHNLYEKARDGDKAATAELKAANDADWQRFNERQQPENQGRPVLQESPEQTMLGQPRPEGVPNVREPGAEGVLPRPQGGAGEAGGGRGGVGQGERGQEAAGEGRREAQPGEGRGGGTQTAVQQLPVAELALDPKRFQYKLDTDASGVSNLLKGRRWNDELAGLISVWRDPKDGRIYVVNGHHRFQLAQDNGITHIWTRMIQADDAETARATGALQNIAEGRGTALDAAKFFRDSGYTPEQLDKHGISMGEATAANGVALARLDPSIFDQVVHGKLRQGRAIAIGNASADPADQEALLKLIQKAESKGKKVTDDVVDELARLVKGAGQQTETQQTLFGAQEMTKNLALEKADISSYIRERLVGERRIFASVADAGRAAQLGTVKGQQIKPEENAARAQEARQAQEIYDRLSTRGGTIDDVLNRAARELADGGNANGIKQRAYDDTRRELSAALGGATGAEPEGVQAAPGGSAAPGAARTGGGGEAATAAPATPGRPTPAAERPAEPAAAPATSPAAAGRPGGEPTAAAAVLAARAAEPQLELTSTDNLTGWEPPHGQTRGLAIPVEVRGLNGDWVQGILRHWTRSYNGQQAAGRVELADGTIMREVPAKYLREPAAPAQPAQQALKITSTEIKPLTHSPGEAGVIARTKANAEQMTREYLDKNTNNGVPVLATDLAKELYPEFQKDPVNHDRNVAAGSKAIRNWALDTALAQPVDPARPDTLITTASPGSGKTSSMMLGGDQSGIGMKIEQISDEGEGFNRLIQKVIDSGRKPVVEWIYVDSPGETVRRMARRAVGHDGRPGIGRTVELEYMAEAYYNLPRVLEETIAKFGDKANFLVVDNSGPLGTAKVSDDISGYIDKAKQMSYDQIKGEMYETLDNLKATGLFNSPRGQDILRAAETPRQGGIAGAAAEAAAGGRATAGEPGPKGAAGRPEAAGAVLTTPTTKSPAEQEVLRIARFNKAKEAAKGRMLNENAAQARPEAVEAAGRRAVALDADSAVLWHRAFANLKDSEGRSPLGAGQSWTGMTLPARVARTAATLLREMAGEAKKDGRGESADGYERMAKALEVAKGQDGLTTVLRGDYRDDTAREEAWHAWAIQNRIFDSDAMREVASRPEVTEMAARLRKQGYSANEIAHELLAKAMAGDPALEATEAQRVDVAHAFLRLAVDEFGPEILKEMPPVERAVQAIVDEMKGADYGREYDQRIQGGGEPSARAELRPAGGEAGRGVQSIEAGRVPREPGEAGRPQTEGNERGAAGAGEAAGELAAQRSGEAAFQRGKPRPIKPEDSLALPGMEGADVERRSAAGEEQGRLLTEEMRRPGENIDRMAGEMERNAPLFAGTEAGGMASLFQRAIEEIEPDRNRLPIEAYEEEIEPDRNRLPIEAYERDAKLAEDSGASRSGRLDGPTTWQRALGAFRQWRDQTPTPATELKGHIRENLGEYHRNVLQLQDSLKAAREAFVGVDEAKATDIIDNVEHGRYGAIDAEHRPIMVGLHNMLEEDRLELQKLDPEQLKDFYENYFPHLWDQSGKVARQIQAQSKSIFGAASFLQHRTLYPPTFKEGISIGLRPKTWNPVDMALMKHAEIQKYIFGLKTVDWMENTGMVKTFTSAKDAPAGWAELAEPYGRVMQRNDAGELVERGRRFAPADAAEIFNNFVSRGLRGKNAALDAAFGLNNGMNRVQLGLSGFHGVASTLHSAVNDIGIALMQGTQGRPEAATTLARAAVPGASMARAELVGTEMLKEYLNPGSAAKYAAEASWLSRAGGMPGQSLNLEPTSLRKVRDAFAMRDPKRVAKNALPAALEASSNWLMGPHGAIVRLKLGMFQLEAANILKEAPARGWDDVETRQRMQKAWDSIDNRYGQLVYENLFAKRWALDLAQLGIRSVGWNLGSFREYFGGASDTARAAARVLARKRPEFTTRMAFTMATPIYFGMATAAMDYLINGKGPDTEKYGLKAYFYPEMPDGSLMSWPGYMKDWFSFGMHPVQTVLNKTSPLLNAVAEQWENKDYYGNQIRNEDDPLVKQLWQSSEAAAKEFVPFSFRSVGQQWRQAGEGEFGAVGKGRGIGMLAYGALGFQPAPKQIQNSPAMNQAEHYIREMPEAPRTEETAARSRKVRNLVEALREGKLDEDKLEGVSSEEYRRALKEANEAPIVTAARRLTMEQALHVWKKASAAEREQLQEVMTEKAAKGLRQAAQENGDEAAKDLMARLDEAGVTY